MMMKSTVNKQEDDGRANKKRTAFWQSFSVTKQIRLRGHFIRTQATGAGINVARRSVNDCLYTLYIRFPSSVRTSMRMGNLNSESDTFPQMSHFAIGLHLL